MQKHPLVLAGVWALIFLGFHGSCHGQSSRLRQRCEKLVAEAKSQGITPSVCVRSLKTGKLLFGANPDRGLVPASNQKIVTVGAAMLGLGGEHLLLTDLLLHGSGSIESEDGVTDGHLRLRGEGDPTLTAKRALPLLVSRVLAAGIKTIKGDVIVDDSLFDQEFRAAGWPKGAVTKGYMAQVAALSLDHGCVELSVSAGSRPGAQASSRILPAGCGVTLKGAANLKTTAKKSEHVIHATRNPKSNVITVGGKVWSSIKDQRHSLAIYDPAMVFGRALASALREAGVKLEGTVRRLKPAEKLEQGLLLARLSTPVSAVISYLMKRSQNHRSEMLFKHMAVAKKGKGSFANGADAVSEIFSKVGVSTKGAVFADGSGLSYDNRISAAQLTAMLRAIHQSSSSKEFLESMPYGGDAKSTLSRRLKELGKRVRAKTGTLRISKALSGFVVTDSGETLAFSVLMNSKGGKNSKKTEITDKLVRLFAKF